MTPTSHPVRLPRHAKKPSTAAMLKEIEHGARENFDWLPGFGKHRATTQEGVQK